MKLGTQPRNGLRPAEARAFYQEHSIRKNECLFGSRDYVVLYNSDNPSTHFKGGICEFSRALTLSLQLTDHVAADGSRVENRGRPFG